MMGYLLMIVGVAVILATWMGWFGYFGLLTKAIITIAGVAMIYYGYQMAFPPTILPIMGGRRKWWKH